MESNKFENIFYGYLQSSISRKSPLGYKITKKIFLQAIGDYLNNKIDTDILGGIATLLYYDKNIPEEADSWSDGLGSLLHRTSEFDYYAKKSKKTDKIALKEVEIIETSICNYLKKYS